MEMKGESYTICFRTIKITAVSEVMQKRTMVY